MSVTFDTSAWINYFTASKSGPKVKRFVESGETILTPTICLMEFKTKYVRERAEYQSKIDFISSRSSLVPLDKEMASAAADLKIKYHLHTTDAVVYAVARNSDSLLLTSDAHFANLPKTRVI
ncbi:MAG: type II toxin-antitoxin system VapC family toxin [Candidatus Micrarchaeota archaeon]|nr:type II toxin-antitoxin system VapC family toxin [Candidatus Micrarchaeota archaeon]